MKNKNQKLIILVGISGSGKSTWATNYIKNHPNTVRVNRDDMRKQILGKLTQDYYSKSNSSARIELEKHITVLQNEQIRYWLLKGYNVIADNTHLRDNDIKNYKIKFQHLASINIKYFSIHKLQAKERVLNREECTLNELNYIDHQEKQYEKIFLGKNTNNSYTKRTIIPSSYNPNLPNCYIVDIDGTIADCTGVRSPYDGSKLHLDEPIGPVRNVLNSIEDIAEIIYLSGREDKWRDKTKKWILDNGFPDPIKVYMRKTGDYRRDSTVKEKLYRENIEGKYNVLGVFDDRKQVKHECWNKLGLFVFDVNQKDVIF